jgi:hypothetical protein
MANLQTLFDLADPRIRKIWDEKDTQLSKRLEYSGLGLTDGNAEILAEQFENFTGLGYATLTGEKEPYSREDILPASKVTIQSLKYTKAIDITEEMLRFNLWPKINNLVGGVANSLNATINLTAAKIHYLGFGTTFFTGGDGSALYATHTLGDGSTQSNTTTNPLSYDAIKTAIQAMNRFRDDKGIQLTPATNFKLIVPIEKKERAMEVLKSIGNPDSANRINNVFGLGGESNIEIFTSHWMPPAYSTYWWLIAPERASYMAHMRWGWRPKFDSDNIVNNGTKIYTGSTMFAPGFQSWQWAYGSSAST